MRGFIKRIAAFAGALMLASFPSLALSETAEELPGIRSSYDENDVDLAGLQARFIGPSISIGQPGAGGMSFQRNFIEVASSSVGGWSHTYDIQAYLDTPSIYNVTIVFGGRLDEFDASSSTVDIPSSVGSGAVLTLGSTTSVYTSKTGDKYNFTMSGGHGELSSIQYASGEVVTYTYSTTPARRLMSVNNNFGYQIKFEYYANSSATDPDTYRLYKAIAINNAVDYCDPAANSCSGFTQAWPTLTYSDVGTLGYNTTVTHTITDSLNRQTSVTIEKYRITSVQRPTGPTATYSRLYISGRPTRVTAVTKAGSTWSYAPTANRIYGEVRPVTEYTVTDPESRAHKYEFDDYAKTMAKAQEPDGSFVFYEYNEDGTLLSQSNSQGVYSSYTYDGRGNLLSKTTYPAVGDSSLPSESPITTSATYEATCTSSNILYCNKPTTTTDARGNVTNYYYSATHGGLTQTTAPSPDGTAARPETRTTYVARQAYYRTGVSSWGSGSTVYLPETTKTCTTGAGNACANATNEVVAEVGYGSTSGANNLLPVMVSVRAGNGSSSTTAVVSTTYDVFGDVESVDGPLKTADGIASDDADTTRYRYDALRRVVGVIGPDPDGSGPLKPRAVRKTYHTSSSAELVEEGAMTSATGGLWDSNFTVSGKVETSYDTRDRPVKTLVRDASNTILSVAQTSYNSVGQVVCQTRRLNTSDFSSSIAACTQGTGSKDEIIQNGYDGYGRLTTVTSGVGTSLSQVTQTIAYHPPAPWYTYYPKSGKIESVTDANGNKTSYLYDRFARSWKVFYPSPSSPGTSSTTDYEQFGYDASGNVISQRLRDGTNVTFAYDALSRMTTDMQGGTLAYDNLDRVTSTTKAGQTITNAYDVFDNLVSQTSALGTVSYEYDLAGRRTKTMWPDSFYVTYGYNAASDLLTIKENGAAALITLAYDDRGRRSSMSRANGTSTTYNYDSASDLSSLTLSLAGSSTYQVATFTRDPLGRVLSRSGANASFDSTAGVTSTTSYSNNGLNQTTAAGGVTLGYDGRGNLTSSGPVAYTYDIANRMLTAENGSITLAYDPVGRLREYAGTTTTRFLYDDVDMIAEYNTSGSILRRYIHGPGDDEPLVWFEGAGHSGSGSPDRRYLIADERGSIVAVTDGSGAVLAINTYDEYGAPATTNATYAGRFRYTGQAWLADLGVTGTGLYYYKARMYSPALGRFMQTDPIGYGDGMNLYAYVGNDPINSRDPTGLCSYSDGYSECETTVSELPVIGKRDSCDAACHARIARNHLEGALDWYNRFKEDHQVIGFLVDNFTPVGTAATVAEFALKPTPGGFLMVAASINPATKLGSKALRTAVKACTCFEAGTLVETAEGQKPIEQIQVGDLVLARDDVTGETAFKPVLNVFLNKDVIWAVTLEVTASDGKVRLEQINTTAEHPFMTAEGRWVEVAGLMVGAQVRTADGRMAVVMSRANTNRLTQTYNLEVADFHTFFVGEAGVWVHNACRNLLKPIKDAVGPHSTFRRGPDGRITNYQTWTPNPRNPSGFDAGPRFRADGKLHGGVSPPLINEGGMARPALPGEIPKGW